MMFEVTLRELDAFHLVGGTALSLQIWHRKNLQSIRRVLGRSHRSMLIKLKTPNHKPACRWAQHSRNE